MVFQVDGGGGLRDRERRPGGVGDHGGGHGRGHADLALAPDLGPGHARVVLAEEPDQGGGKQPLAHGLPGKMEMVLHDVDQGGHGAGRTEGRGGHGQPAGGVAFGHGQGVAADKLHEGVRPVHGLGLMMDALGLAVEFERRRQ